MGDLRPEFPRGNPGYVRDRQTDEGYAWTAFMLGRPLLGQRVTDLLAVVKAIKGPLKVVARGWMTVPARFAAELDLSIKNVFAFGGPESYRQMLDQEDAGPTSNLLFDVLSHVDLPELARGRITEGREWSSAAIAAFLGL